MGRPREHGEAVRAAILEAAEALLAEGGPDAMSVRRISQAAGTTTRAVYSLFGGIDGLRAALYRNAFAGLRARLQALPGTDDAADDLVRLGCDGFRSHALAHPELFRLAFEWSGRHSHTAPADQAAALAVFDILVAHVARVTGAGASDPATRRQAAGFHALCQGLASGEIAGLLRVGVDLPALWRDSVTAYVRGLAP